ncbi:head-tail connector protein [Acinetobacter courvalinii]|uniref:head-tail connector protein n=1 Tax=Acinetobacter courvalinii TaxID=280147 RepID=UPI00289A529D|nr:head-tail connector protein [Acinetobacter courvalinii]
MITLDQAKLHCRIDEDDEDSLIMKWIADAEEVIQNDLDRKVIVDEADRESETDILDNDWLDSARLIYVQYRYGRSLEGKPQAYWDLLQKFRIMGV